MSISLDKRSERTAELLDNPNPTLELRLMAAQQTIRFAMHAFKKIMDGEADPQKRAELTIKHLSCHGDPNREYLTRVLSHPITDVELADPEYMRSYLEEHRELTKQAMDYAHRLADKQALTEQQIIAEFEDLLAKNPTDFMTPGRIVYQVTQTELLNFTKQLGWKIKENFSGDILPKVPEKNLTIGLDVVHTDGREGNIVAVHSTTYGTFGAAVAIYWTDGTKTGGNHHEMIDVKVK